MFIPHDKRSLDYAAFPWNFCSGILFILVPFEPFMWLTPQYFLWLTFSDANDLMILLKNNLAQYWPHGSRALENHRWFSGRAGMLENIKPQRPSLCWPAKDLCWKSPVLYRNASTSSNICIQQIDSEAAPESNFQPCPNTFGVFSPDVRVLLQ